MYLSSLSSYRYPLTISAGVQPLTHTFGPNGQFLEVVKQRGKLDSPIDSSPQSTLGVTTADALPTVIIVDTYVAFHACIWGPLITLDLHRLRQFTTFITSIALSLSDHPIQSIHDMRSGHKAAHFCTCFPHTPLPLPASNPTRWLRCRSWKPPISPSVTGSS